MLITLQCRRQTTMTCNWRACLVTLSLAFIHTCASTQRQPQRPEPFLQAASTEASESSPDARLAFSDLLDSDVIDAGPSSVAFPDVSKSNSFYPGLSSSEVGQSGNDEDVGPLLATRGYLQLPPPASLLHLQPLNSVALSGPQGEVEGGSAPALPLPYLRIPSTVAKFGGSTAPSAQSRGVRQEAQRQRPEIELLTGMQQELTKLSREVETLAASSSTRVDSGLHFVGTRVRDSQTANEHKAASDGKSAGPASSANDSTTAAADAIGDATVYSKIGMIVPVALQIGLVVAIVHCVMHLNAEQRPDGWAWLKGFLFLITADIIWVCVCLTGLMDEHVRHGVVVSICILLVVGNLVIIGVLVFHMVRKNRFVKAVQQVPDDILVVKGVVKQMLSKLEDMAGTVSDTTAAVGHVFDPEFDSSDEKESDPATQNNGEAIRITILEAMDLPETNREKFPFFLGTGSNAYCSCAVRGRPEFQFKTRTKLGSKVPKWHHRYLFKYLWPEDVLLFRVWDIHDKLGEYEASLQELQKGLGHSGEITLNLKDAKERATPKLVIRIESATAEHLLIASKFDGTGLEHFV